MASLVVTTNNQQGALPFTPTWAPAPDSLTAGLAPTNATGNFSEEVSGRNANSLTSGGSLTISQIQGYDGTTCGTNYVTCGNGGGAGSNLVYTLPASTNGYDITNITVYGGWQDNGRDQQAYTIFYSTADAPANFIRLTAINYLPSVPGGIASATRVVVSDSAGGAIASNVTALEFDFLTPTSENGYCGYAAITAEGTKSSPPSGPPIVLLPTETPANANVGLAPGTSVKLTGAATGSLPLAYQWRTDGGSGGACTNIPGATGVSLVVDTTDFAPGTYRYDYVASNSFGTDASQDALIVIITMTDIGASAPSPGPLDLSQLLNTSQDDDGINYYTDNGAAYGTWCGQTFTTGGNQNGYLLETLAWKSAGNGSSFSLSQLYDLYLYSVSPDGGKATVIASYQGDGGGTENDWFEWQGLKVPLAPNQMYAYALGRDASATGWEHIGDQSGNPYPGGQIMAVPNTTGTGPVTYGATGTSDAAFDLGLTAYTLSTPRALLPALASGVYPIYSGMTGSVTLNETALGFAPFTYQWLSDNGSGGALSPVTGATSSNIAININTFAAGNYNYAVVVSNAVGFSISPSFTLNVLGSTAPSLVSDITPAPLNTGNAGDTVQFAASFTGSPPISYQWFFDNGYGPAPLSTIVNPSASNTVLTLSNIQLSDDGIYSVVSQNSAGSAASSDSTLIVTQPGGTPPPRVTVPPVTLHIANPAGTANVLWSQGTLLQSTNVVGPWIAVATNLELTNYPVSQTNSTMFYKAAVASQPRIVNIYCFCRDQDYRTADSQAVLFNCTTQEVQLVQQVNLPATFALQYDALMDTNYQNYFKQHVGTNIEIGAWWEIPQELVEAAGLTWRGSHEWDSTADVDFSCGYSPAERTNLVDAYMARFKSVFGYYPKTVGSWYIDEITLAYMASKYGVVASCNCKDQLGTDTYTMWGGYWNQAYYPSRINSYMPAQTQAGQIDVPIFRMLGSDPIYQYGSGVITLEPVYSPGGGSADWVAWFMNNLIQEPSLAFAYTQAGQENDIQSGWSSIGPGLTRQVALIAVQVQAKEIQAMTLAQAGQWFGSHYSVTPPTSVVALDDWQSQGRKSVWYDSRFYRLNLLWDQGTFYVRDLHCFDENVPSGTYTNALATTYFDYQTLPVMDQGTWSGSGTNLAGMWPELISSNGGTSFLAPSGLPIVRELNPTDLSVEQPLNGNGSFSLICTESNVICCGLDGQGQPLPWAWRLIGGSQQSSAVQSISSNAIAYSYLGGNYTLQIAPGSGSCQQLDDGSLQLNPNAFGKLVMTFSHD